MTDSRALLADLQRLVVAVQSDLRERAGQLEEVQRVLHAEYERAKEQERTALSFVAWREEALVQVAVAWVLACVFVRYLEDNELIDECWLGGADNRRREEARHRHQLYFREHPRHSDREYLQHVFRTVGAIPAASELFAEDRTPLWVVGPSGDMARDILAFWQDPARGALERTFTAIPGDTRFLGDLYQDLSEEARKKFALLQTPGFVEEFILDRTLSPALDEFGLEAVRLIDPTCGSGHFLLGAFERLFKEWQKRWQHTGDVRDTNRIALAQKALDQIYGVDINPYAVAIARFRLVVAAVHACGLVRLKDAPAWRLHVHSGDSLYYGARWTQATNTVNESLPLPGMEAFVNYHGLEDPGPVNEVLSQKYHVVVGNPPYITVKDSALSQTYRARYKTCHRQYSLGVPFTERFFDLCLAEEISRKDAKAQRSKEEETLGGFAPLREISSGYVGMITANSFMKREFGKKLIEQFFPQIDLTHVIDTSGAYIPGHGTPTVILFGRNRKPVGDTVRAVLGIRGEPSTPHDPSQGLVWRSIIENVDRLGAETGFTSTTDVPRSTFAKHPWSIGGGGAAELKELLDERGASKLRQAVMSIGFFQDTHADEAFVQPLDFGKRHGLTAAFRLQVRGDEVRDWCADSGESILFPYDDKLVQWADIPQEPRWSWFHALKTELWSRSTFGGGSYRSTGRAWFDYHQFPKDRARTPLSIGFAFVATHNQFVLDRGGRVFNQSAPIIKLPADASEDDHLGLLGLLNSSTACFWMKQVCHNKGLRGQVAGITSEAWEQFSEFAGTILESFPLPEERPLNLAQQLDASAREFAESLPESVVRRGVPTRKALDAARQRAESIRRQMIALQEELDWQCYHLYGLLEEDLTQSRKDSKQKDALCAFASLREISLGERAFEIVLARKVTAGEVQTAWFERHRSTPITEIPKHWPADYRVLVEKRIAAIEANPSIALIEQPEYKRRWNSEPWEDQEKRALRGWLLDRLETERYWPRPAQDGEPLLQSCAQLAATAQTDADFMQVGALYTDNPVFDVLKLIEELVASESVPYLPVLRYKPSGLLKRTEWEKTWNLQRREDAGEHVGAIPVPPKYTSADFQNSDYWRLRVKLDVPKERWVSYPFAERDGDGSLVVTWAGYDHLEQARALAAYFVTMKDDKGWPAERLLPLLAGIDQLVPWLLQWHNDYDPEMQLRWGEHFRDFVRDEAKSLGRTLEDVRNWEPPEKKRTAPSKRKQRMKAEEPP
jgi:hypothetical protein